MSIVPENRSRSPHASSPSAAIQPVEQVRTVTIASGAPARIASLDQLRGYAVVGMFLVNYLGYFAAMPWFIDHQRDSFSYADTIAPLFLFVVGMGFRLSLKRRAEKAGLADARLHSIKRYTVLFIIAIAFYGPDYQKDWWDALTEIALAGLLTLVFIDKPVAARVAAAFGYLGAFMYFFYGTGYGAWLHDSSMNGGPLGALGASCMLLFGSIAFDLLDSGNSARIVRWSLIWGVGLVATAFIAWVVLPRAYGDYTELGVWWPFAKRWGAAPFVLLSTGLAFLTFLLFYYLVDIAGYSFSHLTLFGENPLVIYLVQYALLEMNGVYLPERFSKSTGPSSVVLALIGFAVFYGFMYAIARRLHKDKIIIKL